VALLLGTLGAVVLWDASRISSSFAQRGPVGPTALPIVVGVMLLLCAVLLGRDVLKGGHGESETGEDVDLSEPSDWRTLLVLVGVFLANAYLIERAGFVIAATILFWGSAYALGSRRYLRDGLIAVVLSVLAFYLFAEGLGIGLPAGWLKGIL
jgi:putative tricarboxylic transport membrane protein